MGKCYANDSDDVYDDVIRFFEQKQKDEMITVSITEEQLKQADPQKLLNTLDLYFKSDDSGVKSLAASMMYNIAKLHPIKEVKQRVTTEFVKGLVSNSGTDTSLLWKYGEQLSSFAKEDFSESSKELLHNALAQKNPAKEVIMTCGAAGMKEELPRLKELKQSITGGSRSKWYYTKSWYVRLAMARIGDKNEIETCVKSMEDEIDKNDAFQLLDRLGYIRQPEAIKILKKYLDSKKMLPDAGDDVLMQSYASYVMDILIDSLDNFPIEKKPGRGYKSDQIKEARKWMSNKKNWKIIR